MSGTTEYERRWLPVWFPKGFVFCELCPALETYARRQCRRTGEYLLEGKRGEITFGGRCPLLTDEEVSMEVRDGQPDMRNGGERVREDHRHAEPGPD